MLDEMPGSDPKRQWLLKKLMSKRKNSHMAKISRSGDGNCSKKQSIMLKHCNVCSSKPNALRVVTLPNRALLFTLDAYMMPGTMEIKRMTKGRQIAEIKPSLEEHSLQTAFFLPPPFGL